MHRPSVRELLALLRRGLVGVEDVREAAHLLMRGLDVQAMSLGRGFGFTPLAVTHDVADSWQEHHRRWLFLDPSPAFLAQSGRVPYHVAIHSKPEEKVRPLFRGFVAHGFGDATISRYDGFNGPHYMALYRAKSRRGIDADEALVLELLHPHLERGLSTALAATAIDGSVEAPIPLAWVDLRPAPRTSPRAPRARSSSSSVSSSACSAGASSRCSSTAHDARSTHLRRCRSRRIIESRPPWSIRVVPVLVRAGPSPHACSSPSVRVRPRPMPRRTS